MKVAVQIHPTEARHEFAAVHLIIEELDTRIPLDINFDPYLRFSATASAKALDLLLISAVVYAADKSVNRELFNDHWMREFEISMPVHEPDRWNAAASQLSACLSFLTGDKWRFEFVQAKNRWIRKKGNSRIKACGFPSAPLVSLLSGGLDSFIGALDLIKEHPDRRLLFASHYDGKIPGPMGDQDALEALLIRRFPNRLKHFQLRIGPVARERISRPASREWIKKQKGDLNLRSRSFVFLGIGVLAAHKIGAGTPVHIPENGPIALNMPLNPSRRGSCSTRTVHPHFLALVNELLAAAGIDHPVSNPYSLKTKGEMVSGCKSPKSLIAGYKLTNSCAKSGHNRHWEVRTANGCGACVPCIFRRASLHVSGLDDEPYGNDVLAKSPQSFDDFHALLGLIRRNPDEGEIARTLMANGRLPVASIGDFVGVEMRMITEVSTWLRDKASSAIKKYAKIK